MKKAMGLFLTLAALCSCSGITKQTSKEIAKITTRALRQSDITMKASDNLTSITIQVMANVDIKIITMEFVWHYINGDIAKNDAQTEKEMEQGESRNFTSNIEAYQAIMIKDIEYKPSGTVYI